MTTPQTTPLVTITLDTEIGGWLYDEDGEPVGRGRTIADAIISQAADRLVAKLHDEVRQAVMAQVEEQIVEQVGDLIGLVVSNPVQLTNTFGEPTGRTVSVREQIAEQVAKQLKPYDSRSYGGTSVLQKIIDEQVKIALANELGAAVKAARDKVVGAVRDSAADLIAKAVRDGLR